MSVISRVVNMAILLTAIAAVSPALAQTYGCQSRMHAYLGVLSDIGVQYGGKVAITSCKGLWLRFEDGTAVNAEELFATQQGYDFFEMNLKFIAENFVAPPSEEYSPQSQPFSFFPKLSIITENRSDLAVEHNGAANTVVFRFKKDSDIAFLQVYESSGIWFEANGVR